MLKPMTVERWHASSPWIPSGDVALRITELQASLMSAKDYRERKRHARALAFCCTSAAVSDADFSAGMLAQIIAAGQLAKRNGGATELLGRSMLHLVRRRLDLLGIGEPVTLSEKKKRVVWDGGCLAVGTNATDIRTMMSRSERDIVKAMNAGAFYLVNVGSDGSAPLTLRIVDSIEPMLPMREFAKTDAVSDVGWLDIKDGPLQAGAAEYLESGAKLSVATGRYAVRLFSTRSRLTFVACRSNAAFEELRDTPSL
jgi:hypothetical protein